MVAVTLCPVILLLILGIQLNVEETLVVKGILISVPLQIECVALLLVITGLGFTVTSIN
jgi:hypothetical protein